MAYPRPSFDQEFHPSDRLLQGFGVGLFAYPHGFMVDAEGNLWASDVNDEAMILGLSAKTADGAGKGQGARGAQAQPDRDRRRPNGDIFDVGTSASGIAADDAGTIYAADVGTHGLRKYLKVRQVP